MRKKAGDRCPDESVIQWWGKVPGEKVKEGEKKEEKKKGKTEQMELKSGEKNHVVLWPQ